MKKKKLTPGQKKRREVIMLIVDAQIKQGDPPETRETLERLVNDGYTRSEARELIAVVVASEIFDVLKQQQPFDRDRFITRLLSLPILPGD